MATEIRQAAWPRVMWGAVIAGVFFSLAAHIVLGLFGMAWGFRVDPADPTGAVGIGAAVWAVLVPFLASFVGALVAVRLAGIASGAGPTIHGLLTWCIGLAVGGLFITGTLAENYGLGSVARAGLAGVDITPVALAAGIGTVSGLIGALAGVLAGRRQMEGERMMPRMPRVRFERDEAGHLRRTRTGYRPEERPPTGYREPTRRETTREDEPPLH